LTKVFWDSNLFIYLFEENAEFLPKVTELRRRMITRGDSLFTSSFTVGEVLVKPFESNHSQLIQRYQRFFRSTALTVLSFDLAAAECYAAIRADRTITRPDAIQLACAAAAGIDLFVTNDERLVGRAVRGIKFVTSIDRAPL
jgi:predicted nucleic acid-binding protein